MSKLADSLQGQHAAEMRLLQRLQIAMPEASKVELADLLQLEIASKALKKHKQKKHTEIFVHPAIEDSDALKTHKSAYPPLDKVLPFLYLSQIKKKKHKTNNKQPSWVTSTESFSGEVQSRMGEAIEPEPLLTWEQIWPSLHALFKDLKKTRQLDTKRIIKKAISQQPMLAIPWKQKCYWPSELILIVDFSPHLSPYFCDYKMLTQRLTQWFQQRLKVIFCIDSERQHYIYNGCEYQGFPIQRENAEMLYIGDLGFLDQQGISSACWHQLAEKLHRQNVRFEALLTVHPMHWDPGVYRYFHLYHFDHNRQIHKQPKYAIFDPSVARLIAAKQTQNLLSYLSLAIELTPALVRKVRLKLGFNVSVESLIFQHRALKGNAYCFQWRTKTYQQQYRGLFDKQGYNKQQVWDDIKEFENELPIELQIEQRQKFGKPLNLEQKRFIQRLVVSQRDKSLSEDSEKMLLSWIERMVDRSVDEEWKHETVLLYALYQNANKDRLPPEVPQGIDLTKLPEWISGENTRSQVILVQKAGSLFVLPIDEKTTSAGVELAQFYLSDRSQLTFMGNAGHEKQALQTHTELVIPDNVHEIKVETTEQVLAFDTLKCPSWAFGIGRDPFGLFVEVLIKNIKFIMRWIPPGDFLMGSPKGEPERYDDEGPQQKITFTQGYWLAETACTQALWQAVMGEHPSRFDKDPQNPVESISWDDTKKFIKVLNGLEAGFDFRLPSEAEWEYACRAGTQTPFWFGNKLTTEHANYSGNYPYNEGKKGEYREQTMAVKSFKQNHWGLYQMHGNVWEWCEDIWQDNHKGADPGGRARVGNSKDHVCRGGSWAHDGGRLRSAFRLYWHVGRGNTGFRLALGSGSLGQQEEAVAALRQRNEGRMTQSHGSNGKDIHDEN